MLTPILTLQRPKPERVYSSRYARLYPAPRNWSRWCHLMLNIIKVKGIYDIEDSRRRWSALSPMYSKEKALFDICMTGEREIIPNRGSELIGQETTLVAKCCSGRLINTRRVCCLIDGNCSTRCYCRIPSDYWWYNPILMALLTLYQYVVTCVTIGFYFDL